MKKGCAVANVLLFHHALGRTGGVLAIAAELGRAGHVVHTPDLYDGRTFDELEAGVAYAEEVGFASVIERGVAAAASLPNDVVYAGFSLGVLPAQSLAQTRPGAVGALLFEACVSPEALGSPWPDGVPVQVHGMAADPFFAGEGDLEVARALVADGADRELFLYEGDGHLFADAGLSSYDPAAAELLTRRVLGFLDGLGAEGS